MNRQRLLSLSNAHYIIYPLPKYMDKKLLDIVSEIQKFRKRAADQRFAPFHKFIRDVIASFVDISFLS